MSCRELQWKDRKIGSPENRTMTASMGEPFESSEDGSGYRILIN
jgi:hypothetical protein